MANDNELRGAKDRARTGGSGFTVFTWQEQIISFARQISHQSPQPVGPGVVPIHPMDTTYPVEIITPMATTMGSITLELYELYGAQVWERLAFLGGSNGDGPVDLAGIYRAVSNTPDPIRIAQIIKPPRIRGRLMPPYTEEYHNCVIATLDDGVTIEVGTMEVLKRLTVNYTHLTRGGRNDLLDQQQLGRDSTSTDFG